jgi:hypothetical protein
MTTGIQIAFDASDPHSLARFWAEALGYEVEDHSEIVGQLVAAGDMPESDVIEVDGHPAFREVAAARDPGGTRPRLFFQLVPEPKTAKNRCHLDLHVGVDSAQAEADRLVGLGAGLVGITSDRGPVNYTLRDPQGNEFCVS